MYFYFVQFQQFDDMAAENLPANQTLGNTTKMILNHTTSTATFFDPALQIALTIEFYFQYAVIAIGIFGMAANALILYALIAEHAQNTKKRAINLLIINQNLLDMSSCILLVISYSTRLRPHVGGVLGYIICTIFYSEGAVYSTLNASVINLITLTIERYLKVVHPFWSKKNLKPWMIHTAMVFAWIGGTLYVIPTAFTTTILVDGMCLSFYIWQSPAASMVYMTMMCIIFFFIPLVTFIYCYGRIVIVMRRQMRVMAGHNAEGSAQMSASQMQSKRIKWNIIKTMIIVSTTFIICWFPNNIYFMIVDTSAQTSNLYVGYFFTVFMVYLNTCMNPFIYALKHDGVKQRLARMMTCRKGVTIETVSGTTGNSTGGTQQIQVQTTTHQ